jgi:hypothetical protein
VVKTHHQPVMSRIAAAITICLAPLQTRSATAEMDRLDAIRGYAEQAPILETTVGPGAPKYQVIRLNASAQEYAGNRYGLIRLKLPPSEPYTLVLLFADVGNIVEYEIMPRRKGAMPLKGNTRLIHPALVDHDREDEAETPVLTLPKPWDHFELHLLGFGPELLKPGEEYLLWFRFANKQPADVLLAATLLKGAVDLEPEKLPPLFGLPEHKDE